MLIFSIGDIHEYECLNLLIFNCKYFRLPETRIFYRLGMYFSILCHLGFFCHLVINFLICFPFIYIFPNNPCNLPIITFLLWSVNFIFFGILSYWWNNQLIVLAAVNITWKIDNYHYNNFLVEKKKFTTIIINSVEKTVLSRS